MAEQDAIYKCNICGNVVSVIEAHEGTLVCCGKDMELQEAKGAADEGKEKHVPIIAEEEGVLKVKVGAVPHPMEEKHYIELIQVMVDGKIAIGKRLNPGDEPVVELMDKYKGKSIAARIYCNVHGLWKSG